MSIITRRAGSHEAGQLHELAALTFGLACPPGTAQADIDAFIAAHLAEESFAGYLADPDRIVTVAEADGALIGYSMLVSGPITDPAVAAVVDEKVSIELSKFYLRPDRHGSGVAAALMAATLQEATATGAEFCWLGVNQQNRRAGKFYTRSGFEIVGAKRFLVGAEWHDDHVRRRPLAP